MMLGRTDPASVRDPDHQWRGEPMPRPVPDPADVADHLIEAWIGEAHELHLEHGPQTSDGHTEADAGDAGLRNRRIDHTLTAELVAQAIRDPEDATSHSDVLAHEDDVVELLQRLCE